MSSAFNQIKNYQRFIPSLFDYNAFSVISDGIHAGAGTLTSNQERFSAWKTITGDDKPTGLALEILIKGMFQKEILLDLIRNFILFQEVGHDSIKILAAYHQYHAVKKAVSRTLNATSKTGDQRIGVVWHTQGSGKSLSMVFYSGILIQHPTLLNPTIIVITDRNDLDDQLYSTFAKSRQLLRSIPAQAESISDLQERLRGRESGGVVFTTIHKFRVDDNPVLLSDRHNIIVIADEAHRSQYGFSAKIVEGREVYGLAKYMRDALPNASFIGFTGTPIEHADKNTPAVFGNYIDTYDMARSVEDGTTVKIYYESRIVNLELDHQERGLIDEQYDEITEYQETTQKDELKRKWARLEKIVGSNDRITAVASDIVDHFEKRQESMETEVGKAIIVAMSRRIAVDLYNVIIKIRPQWYSSDISKGKIKVIMTSASSDPEGWHDHSLSKSDKELVAKRMKDNKDELELVIVVDMWLTGFDVPSLHTMYLDKPMQGHNLMQAIARVNRVFKEKQGGLIVDYIGIADKLKEALQEYSESDQRTAGIDTAEAVSVMLEKLDLVQSAIHPYDYSVFFDVDNKERLAILTGAMNHILGLDKELKDQYLNNVNELSKAFSLCATTPEAQTINSEKAFHSGVRNLVVKLVTDDGQKKTLSQLEAELNQLISKSLKTTEVIDILSAAGLNRPDISILSDEFLEEFKKMKRKNIAVEMLQRLIKGKIRSFQSKSLVKTGKFSELLEQTLRRYQNKAIETTQVIMELIELAKSITLAEKESKNSGLYEDEFAFYETLSVNENAVLVMGSGKLREIAVELARQIKASKTIDWQVRESVRAQMRVKIKVLLKQFGYPPDDPNDSNNYDKSVELVMQQSTALLEL
jgi:type I restriction enzyme R subunit